MSDNPGKKPQQPQPQPKKSPSIPKQNPASAPKKSVFRDGYTPDSFGCLSMESLVSKKKQP